MAQKDIQSKRLEEFKEVFADLVNVLVYQGERIISPGDLLDAPTGSVYQERGKQPREQFRDVGKYVLSGNIIVLYAGIGNQTAEDSDMPFRLMRYDSAEYKRQSSIREKYPVLSLVLYFGLKKWKAPKSIHEALDIKFPGAEKGLPMIADYKMNLVEVAFLPKEVRERFTSDFRIIAEYFYAIRTHAREEFLKSITAMQPIVHVQEVLEFLYTFTKDDYFEKIKSAVCEQAEKGETVTMESMLEYFEKKGMKQGMSQGMKQGMSQGMEQGMKQGMSQGIELGKARINQLVIRLIETGRIDDLKRAAEDEEYQNQLLAELNLQG